VDCVLTLKMKNQGTQNAEVWDKYGNLGVLTSSTHPFCLRGSIKGPTRKRNAQWRWQWVRNYGNEIGLSCVFICLGYLQNYIYDIPIK
jgi:hypothetical protein